MSYVRWKWIYVHTARCIDVMRLQLIYLMPSKSSIVTKAGHGNWNWKCDCSTCTPNRWGNWKRRLFAHIWMVMRSIHACISFGLISFMHTSLRWTCWIPQAIFSQLHDCTYDLCILVYWLDAYMGWTKKICALPCCSCGGHLKPMKPVSTRGRHGDGSAWAAKWSFEKYPFAPCMTMIGDILWNWCSGLLSFPIPWLLGLFRKCI